MKTKLKISIALLLICYLNYGQLKQYHVTKYNSQNYDSFLETYTDWSSDVLLQDTQIYLTEKKIKIDFNEFDLVNINDVYKKKATNVSTLEIKIIDTLKRDNNASFHYKIEVTLKKAPDNSIVGYNETFVKSETIIIKGRLYGFKTPFSSYYTKDLDGCNDIFFHFEYPDKTYKYFLFHLNKLSPTELENKKIEDEENKAIAEKNYQQNLKRKEQRDAETAKMIGDGVNTLINTFKKD